MSNPVFFDSEVSFTTPVETPADTQLGGGLGSGSLVKQQEPDSKAAPKTYDDPLIMKDTHVIEEIPLVLPTVASKTDDEPDNKVQNNKEKPKEVISNGEPSPEQSSSSSSLASVFAKTLAEEGVFTSFDEAAFEASVKEKGPAAAILEETQKAVTAGVEQYKNSLTPLQKKYLNAIDKGIPDELFLGNQARQSRLADITAEDITGDKDLAKSLIVADLRARAYTDEDIEDEIKTIEDLGQVDARATKAHKFLVATEKARETQLDQQAEANRTAQAKRAQDELDTLKTTVNAVKEVIPGTAVTQKEKDDLYTLLTTVVHTEEDSGRMLNAIWKKRLDNPMQFDVTLAYLFKNGVFDGTWDKVIKSTKTAAIKQLNDVFNGEPSSLSSGTHVNQRVSKTSKDILTGMKGFAPKFEE